jgi:hypothetical protein
MHDVAWETVKNRARLSGPVFFVCVMKFTRTVLA